MKQHKRTIIAVLIAFLALISVFIFGKNTDITPESQIYTASQNAEIADTPPDNARSDEINEVSGDISPSNSENTDAFSGGETNTVSQKSTADIPNVSADTRADNDTAAAPDAENASVSEKKLTCTLSVRCDTVLNNMNLLNAEKISIIPDNGIIFPEKEVMFYDGESVFNVLLREMKSNKIHMEFVNTPVYNSAYIEGIANLYEFDCGELSGWMYRVNGIFPNYGCSRYKLKDGDKIEWVYTCDLGKDVGGSNTTGNGG